MARFPLLEHVDFAYLRLQALTWSANRAYLPSCIQANAGKALAALLDEAVTDRRCIVNAAGISSVEDHALEAVRAALKGRRTEVIFLNARGIEHDLRTALGEPAVIMPHDGGVYVYGRDHRDHQASVKGWIEKAASLEMDELTSRVADCFVKHPEPKRMASTPVLATGVFDARSLIKERGSFVSASLLLADALSRWIEEGKPGAFRLLAVSLRSSPLAAALSLLCVSDEGVEIADHFGPKHKILEEYSLRPESFRGEYVFVGDFIIGGTEMKIASAYARSKGSRLTHALAVGSLLNAKDYGVPFNISSLVNLQRACPEASFTFPG